MSSSSHRSAILLSVVALVLILIAQGLIWSQERRLNPGLVLAMALVAMLLVGRIRRGADAETPPGSADPPPAGASGPARPSGEQHG